MEFGGDRSVCRNCFNELSETEISRRLYRQVNNNRVLVCLQCARKMRSKGDPASEVGDSMEWWADANPGEF